MGGGLELGEIEWKDLDLAKLIFFTSVATVIDNGIMYPFWTMKTRQQVQTGAVTGHFNFRNVGGIRNLYRGFLVYSVAALPAYVVYLTTYTYCKSVLGFSYGNQGNLATAMVPLAAGIVADAACLGLYVPVEIVVQRLQLPGRYRGIKHALKDMWREEGLRTFYRGFGATVITSAVSSGVWWVTYENLKKVFSSFLLHHPSHYSAIPVESASSSSPQPTKRIVSRKLSFSRTSSAPAVVRAEDRVLKGHQLWQAQIASGMHTLKQATPGLMAGFLAGGAAAIASNPLDVVKTRLQTQHIKPGPLAFVTNLRQMVVEEGLRKAFLRGIVPKLITTAPLGMLSSVMYEGILYLSRKSTVPPLELETAHVGKKEEK